MRDYRGAGDYCFDSGEELRWIGLELCFPTLATKCTSQGWGARLARWWRESYSAELKGEAGRSAPLKRLHWGLLAQP
jgi:hypothetical protein